MVFTIPCKINDLAYQNKRIIYNILFRTAAKTLLTIAADKKHLGARIGTTLVLHTWGSAMPHHPHVHGIVSGGGLSADGQHWVSCRPGFFLHVRVLSRLFRRLFIESLITAFNGGKLRFFGALQAQSNEKSFLRWLRPLRQTEWVVYAKEPFNGPKAVLSYLARYTHRVAIANSRLISMDEKGVTFKWKDYRKKDNPHQTMTLAPDEFIRRFLMHVLPSRFHRIRHYGMLASAKRKENIELARTILSEDNGKTLSAESAESSDPSYDDSAQATYSCPKCGADMDIIEILAPPWLSRAPPRMRSLCQ